MDTLASAAAVAALVVQVLTSPRVYAVFGFGGQARPILAVILVMILSVASIAGGFAGYHRDWPRWANGRALFAVVVGGLLVLVTSLDLISRCT